MSSLINFWKHYFNTKTAISISEFLTPFITYLGLLIGIFFTFASQKITRTANSVTISWSLNNPIILIILLILVIGLATLTIRRLHGANRSGWLALWGILPIIGIIILLILCLKTKKHIDYTKL